MARHRMPSEEFKKQMRKIFNPAHEGRLHRALGVPERQKIPDAKLRAALHSKDSHVRHMAQADANYNKK